MEVVKQITEEQLAKVREGQNELNQLLLSIGAVESQKHGLLHKIAEVNAGVEEFKKELEAEYGAININLEDGSYEYVEKTEE